MEIEIEMGIEITVQGWVSLRAHAVHADTHDFAVDGGGVVYDDGAEGFEGAGGAEGVKGVDCGVHVD